MTDSFDVLASELGDLLDMPSSAGPSQGLGFCVDGVEFAMARSRSPAELLALYCTFGTLKPDARESDFLLLLETNLMLASTCSGAFGMNATTREVIYAFHLPLRDLTAPLLLDAVRHTAAQAQAWQKARLAQADDGLFSSAGVLDTQPVGVLA